MWVFGYGSLMGDGWEVSRGCVRRSLANLSGYSRAFNKASVRNWGTKASPCPTLNLVPMASEICRGIAFEFSDERTEGIRAYLMEREGKSFALHSLPIQLDDGRHVDALVPIYEGRNIISVNDAELKRLIVRARGTSGSGIEYVAGVARELANAGVVDPAVTNLMRDISS
ncbi:gamma-glutamylcyclotransferase [Bradyrhizobium sp. 197]|uniref:gamma-glutamylcyclotransferase n=1 Tax=Bradyrhizobium sp. 197 TaxID=2782663 RepID=UPI001FF804E0|nr:gamma-glutamylcyclotransferase [Bradyrhizobium sp. 197]MCK1481016.1 gamma-glutamylcyclotransferase [Bradyrhizobium sp. 197]